MNEKVYYVVLGLILGLVIGIDFQILNYREAYNNGLEQCKYEQNISKYQSGIREYTPEQIKAIEEYAKERRE